jgi:ABC-type transporter Mla subunit MlaD
MDRVRLCESQLQDKINAIRDKNDQMRKLNDMKSQLLQLKSAFADDAKGGDPLSNQSNWKNSTDKIRDTAQALSDAWSKAGLDASYVDQIIKSSVDSLSSSSQMDMVRLQSLNNKRSEAFDTMTNMLKKAADSKSSVVSNFR